MEFVRKYIYIIFFIALLLNFVIWDYVRDEEFKFVENTFQALFFVLFYIFVRWLFGWDKPKKDEDIK